MSIFEAIGALTKMAEDPSLMNAAQEIGKAAATLPLDVKEILAEIRGLRADTQKVSEDVRQLWLKFDEFKDPIARPPFTPEDAQAVIELNPQLSIAEKWVPATPETWKPEF